MRFLIVAVGRPRDRELAAVVQEYERRAARYWPLESREVREEPARGKTPDDVRAREGERLLASLGAHVIPVACDAEGTLMRSTEFAEWMRERREYAGGAGRGGGGGAGRDVAFMIGGAFGLAPAVLERSPFRLALARWTLPHEIARLILAEQLYRAGTIGRGEPYHK